MDGNENPLAQLEARSEKNLALWRLNETTDPGHTKPVKLGRSMTAIDAYYQIKRATETFGPVGVGWGWELAEEVLEVNQVQGITAFAKCKVSLWFMDPATGEHCKGPVVIGMNQLFSKAGIPDDEAFKKATTDGITKALSYLGFSADIFMGLYDDSKYVDRMRQEHQRKADATGQKLPPIITKALADLPALNDLDELTITWKALQPDLKTLSAPALDFVKNRFAMRKRQLAPDPEVEERVQHLEGGPNTQP
jgi:uncharacterized short protein YbdD (DUF466 family)